MTEQILAATDNSEPARPYVEIRPTDTPRGEVDHFFLVYGERKLLLTPTEYAILLPVLSDQGRDLEDASEEREALANYNTEISANTAGIILLRLRDKISICFGGDLILPKSKGGSPRGMTLRLFTRMELEALRESISNPDPTLKKLVLVDEFGVRHLFMYGVEIVPLPNQATGISPEMFAIANHLLTKKSFNPTDSSFKATWRELTGKDEIKGNLLRTYLYFLRKAFKPAGYTITKGLSTPSSRETNRYSLVPLPPAPPALAA